MRILHQTVTPYNVPCERRDRQIEEKRAAATAAREAELKADHCMEAARISASTAQEEREAARAVRAAPACSASCSLVCQSANDM